jgi:hypothetical protein
MAGLQKFIGEWTPGTAAHLLRRTTFGPTLAEINEAHNLGLDASIQKLTQYPPLPNPPVNFRYAEDPNVPIGSTWIDAPYLAGENFQGYRRQSLAAWTLQQLATNGFSLREKMTLFWYNHFAIHQINDPKYLYKHVTLLRENALGNFKELVKAVTIDPAMLRFLNGNQNTRQAPNENYARELLELFTIGKGPQVGPGDYSNYTEADVIAIARILTGWRDLGYLTQNPDLTIHSVFVNARHDLSNKQLSARFDNTIIPNMGEQEYAHLVDVIFRQKEVARFICRKLYRWFVYYVIDEDIESTVIEPLAELLIVQGFEIQAVVENLLASTHFYDMLNRGPMIKHPLDFIAGLLRQFEVEVSEELEPQYTIFLRLYNRASDMEMDYYNPPAVAGWKAWYQEPAYYRFWINGATLPIREDFTNEMAGNGIFYPGNRLRIDVLHFLDNLSNPSDVNAVLEDCVLVLLPQKLTEQQTTALRDILLAGLSDRVWTHEYENYRNNPDDANTASSIEGKMRKLLETMLAMAEYYLS